MGAGRARGEKQQYKTQPHSLPPGVHLLRNENINCPSGRLLCHKVTTSISSTRGIYVCAFGFVVYVCGVCTCMCRDQRGCQVFFITFGLSTFQSTDSLFEIEESVEAAILLSLPPIALGLQELIYSAT